LQRTNTGSQIKNINPTILQNRQDFIILGGFAFSFFQRKAFGRGSYFSCQNHILLLTLQSDWTLILQR
jgi:hypothetical protein